MGEYHGIIVKEGLKDQSILKKLRILGEKRTEDWTLLRVSVSENEINNVVKLIQKSLVTKSTYYAHFYRNRKLIIVFPQRTFTLTPNRETWKPAIEYGKSVGIPEEELDFKPCRFEEETY